MSKRPVAERICDYKEIERPLSPAKVLEQASRCMECGVPFCHAVGCPLHNVIPEWNDLVFHGLWRRALEFLHSTNNFPEITGRICPALCEASCTLGVTSEPVIIRQLELSIAEMGFANGWITPQPAPIKSGKKVAVVGSGPAGLAAAQQLARAGHTVVVYEAADRIGGFLRYGIPDFKLDKSVIDRRVEQLKGEGVAFETSVRVGVDLSISYLKRTFSAILLAGGAREPREMPVPGRSLSSIHQAMDYLTQQNQLCAGVDIPHSEIISAAGKRVVILGGGDTGADCAGTAIRQGAMDVLQIEILPKPPAERDPSTPWPEWPLMLRTSSSHEEGVTRRWSISTKEFYGRDGRVSGIKAAEVEWFKDPASGKSSFEEKAGSDFDIPADLVILSLGFIRKTGSGILNAFGLEATPDVEPKPGTGYSTAVPGVFVAGDLLQGPSLVVRAIYDGRQAAAEIDRYLKATPRT